MSQDTVRIHQAASTGLTGLFVGGLTPDRGAVIKEIQSWINDEINVIRV